MNLLQSIMKIRSLIEKDAHDQALELIDEELAKHPHCVSLALLKSICLMVSDNQGYDPKDVERILNKALEENPESVDLVNELAYQYSLKDDLKKAKETFQSVISKAEYDYIENQVGLAQVLLELGEYEEAKDIFLKLNKVFSNNDLVQRLKRDIEENE